MVRILRALVPCVLVVLAAVPAAARDAGPAIADMLAPLLPSVVRIIIWAPSDAATPVGPNGVKPDRTQFYGSGFVIDPSGIIVTNKHVVNNAFSIMVHFADGTTVPGRTLADAGMVDLAVVKVDVPHPLPAMQFGDSNKLRIGDTVLAIGNPLGVGLSVSAGVVSALNRNITNGPAGDFIQTDAAINHGNSGGPLVDLDGKVVGVNSSVYTLPGSGSIGLGFAIPSDDVKFVVGRLLKYGEVRAGWIGATLQDVIPNVAAALRVPQSTGAVVAAVDHNGPAEKAGLQEGDFVLAVDGRTATDGRAIIRQIAEIPVGDTANLSIWRQGQMLTLPVTVADFPGFGSGKPTAPEAATAAGGSQMLGLHAQPVTPELQKKFGLAADQSGLVVTGVDRNSAAGEAGIGTGDVILRVMFDRVTTEDELAKGIDKARASLPFVAFLVRSGDSQRWVGIATKK